jgi:hypothetical protein
LGAAAAVTGPPRSTGPPAAVRSALKKGTDSGILIQTGQKFSVAGHEVAAPAESTVGIEELRVGDGMR